MYFTSGKTHYYVAADRNDEGLDPREPRGSRFRAYTSTAASPRTYDIPARGSISHNAIRVSMSLKDLGKHAPRRGVAFTDLDVYSYEVLPLGRYTDEDGATAKRCG